MAPGLLWGCSTYIELSFHVGYVLPLSLCMAVLSAQLSCNTLISNPDLHIFCIAHPLEKVV